MSPSYRNHGSIMIWCVFMGMPSHRSCLLLRNSLPLENSKHEMEQIAIFIPGQQESFGMMKTKLLSKIVLLYFSVCMSEIYLVHWQNVKKKSYLKDQWLNVNAANYDQITLLRYEYTAWNMADTWDSCWRETQVWLGSKRYLDPSNLEHGTNNVFK